MPMINVWMPKGALRGQQQAELSDKLTHALLLIEGRLNKAIINPAAGVRKVLSPYVTTYSKDWPLPF